MARVSDKEMAIAQDKWKANTRIEFLICLPPYIEYSSAKRFVKANRFCLLPELDAHTPDSSIVTWPGKPAVLPIRLKATDVTHLSVSL